MIPGLNFGNIDTSSITQMGSDLRRQQMQTQDALSNAFQSGINNSFDMSKFKQELALKKLLEERRLGLEEQDQGLRRELGIRGLDQEDTRLNMMGNQFGQRLGEDQRQFNITSGQQASQNMMDNLFKGQGLQLERDRLNQQDKQFDLGLSHDITMQQIRHGNDMTKMDYGQEWQGKQNALDRQNRLDETQLSLGPKQQDAAQEQKDTIYGLADQLRSGELNINDIPPEYQKPAALLAAKSQVDKAIQAAMQKLKNQNLSVGEMQDLVTMIGDNQDFISQLPEQYQKQYMDVVDLMKATLPTEYPFINQVGNTLRNVFTAGQNPDLISNPEYYMQRMNALSNALGSMSNQQINMPRVR